MVLEEKGQLSVVCEVSKDIRKAKAQKSARLVMQLLDVAIKRKGDTVELDAIAPIKHTKSVTYLKR